MSLELIAKLNREKCKLRAYDPMVREPIEGFEYLKIVQNYDEFFGGLQIVVLMTEWPEFRDMPILEKSDMMKEKIIFDTKNFFDGRVLESNGFIYIGTGF